MVEGCFTFVFIPIRDRFVGVDERSNFGLLDATCELMFRRLCGLPAVVVIEDVIVVVILVVVEDPFVKRFPARLMLRALLHSSYKTFT